MRTLKLTDSASQLEIGNENETMRVVAILETAGIKTISQLCKKTKSDLLQIGKIGDITILRIEYALDSYGLTLGMSDDELKEIGNDGLCHLKDVLAMMKDHLHDLREILTEYEGEEDEEDEDDNEDGNENHNDYEEDDDDTLSLNVNVSTPEKPVDWDARLYEVAKEEFFMNITVGISDDVRAAKAVRSAQAFINAMKQVCSK